MRSPSAAWALALVTVLATAGGAAAETADEAAARGQALAREGKHVAAIAAFRAAERAEPRAIHDCLIGLAYLRTGALTEADLAFADCRRRATAPLPAWVAKEEADLAAQLAASDHGTLTLALDPAFTSLTIAGVLEGLPFAPRPRLRLVPGTYLVMARIDDGRVATGAITIVRRQGAQLAIAVPSPGDRPAPAAPPAATIDRAPDIGAGTPAPPTDDAPRPSRAPLALSLTGGGLVVAGALMHALWAVPARDRADDASVEAFPRALDRFETARTVTIATYAVGGAALIAGLVWWQRSPRAPRVTAYVGGDGAGFALQWRR